MIERIRSWAKRMKRDVVALWIAAASPLTPLAARLVAGSVAAYALSPLDLIPDFIPVLGYLDDLLIVPLGLALAIRLIPADLMDHFRAHAARAARPVNWAAAVFVLLLWFVAAGSGGWIWRTFA